MSEIIFLGFQCLGAVINLLLFLSICFLIYLIILDCLLGYKIDVLKDVLDKIEGISEYDCNHLEYKSVESNQLSASDAKKLKQESVTQTEIDNLLKPVFDKISKASEKGDGEIFLRGRGWYWNDNEKYKTAIQQLTDLGYNVWKDNDVFGVRVKW